MVIMGETSGIILRKSTNIAGGGKKRSNVSISPGRGILERTPQELNLL